jgi:hypothetical protein
MERADRAVGHASALNALRSAAAVVSCVCTKE